MEKTLLSVIQDYLRHSLAPRPSLKTISISQIETITFAVKRGETFLFFHYPYIHTTDHQGNIWSMVTHLLCTRALCHCQVLPRWGWCSGSKPRSEDWLELWTNNSCCHDYGTVSYISVCLVSVCMYLTHSTDDLHTSISCTYVQTF